MLGIGAFVAGWISYGTYVGLHDQAQWRLPLGLQMLPAVVLGALIMFFPESPRVGIPLPSITNQTKLHLVAH
jgi:hypothetical protein